MTPNRFGSKEGEEDPYTSVLHGYCKFDDEMSVISVVWRDCYQLIDNYNDEQVGAMKISDIYVNLYCTVFKNNINVLVFCRLR